MSDGSGAGVPAEALRLPPASGGQRIGLFGGSFNPPHKGHRHVALTALARLRLDQVWWLVTPGNPVKSHNDLAPLADRLVATQEFADHPRMVVTALEAAIGTRYTADVIAHCKRRYPTVRFVWLMGADNLAALHTWRKWREILQEVPVAVINRPGARFTAIASPAARSFAGARWPEMQASALADATPPAWVFLHGPLDPSSSTSLREASTANAGAKA